MNTKLTTTLLVVLFCVINGFAQAQSKEVTIFSDNYGDGVISNLDWIPGGNSVTEEEGMMKVATTVTDKGGSLESRWIDIDPQGSLVISRRVKVNYGNEYFIGSFSVSFENDPDLTFGVNYSHYRYRGQASCPSSGFFLFRHNANLSECKAQDNVIKINPVWNKWFDEKIIYNFGTGLLEYYIDGRKQSEFDVGKLRPSQRQRIKLSFNAWGWWTGHYQYFDDFVVSQKGALRSSPQQEKKPITNDDIVGMIKAGLSESTIVLAIQQSPANFDTSPGALIELKNQGATARILDAMLNSAKSTGTQPVPKPVISKPKLKVEYQLYTFELSDCQLFGTRITCELLVTNNDKDRELEIRGSYYAGGRTRLIDQRGNEYGVAKVRLGGDERKENARANLVTGVPFKLVLVFDDMPPDMTTISLLDISVDGTGSVQFRNIPLTIATPTSSESSKRVYRNEFSFDFISCVKSTKVVTCTFALKNNGKADRDVILDLGSSQMVDTSGLQPKVSQGTMGTNSAENYFFGGSIRATLAKGTSINISLSCGDAQSVTALKLVRLSMLSLSVGSGTAFADTFNVDFRDLPLQ
jgi:hypothetical protein